MHKNYQKILDNYGQTFPWINVGGEVYFELQIQNVKKNNLDFITHLSENSVLASSHSSYLL